MFTVSFSIPASNIPIIHGPKPIFEIPFWWVWMARFWQVDLNSGDENLKLRLDALKRVKDLNLANLPKISNL